MSLSVDMNKKMSQMTQDTHRSRLDADIGKLSSLKDEINMNSGYLLSNLKIMEMIDSLRMNGIAGDKNCEEYYREFMELMTIWYDKLYCKMDDEEAEEIATNLNKIEENIPGLYTKSNDELFGNDKLILETKQMLRKIFRQLMEFMQEKGMLTYITQDPNIAITDIGE